jgi:hypothetical protein
MKIEEALHNIYVCYERCFTGTVREHKIMTESLRTIEAALHPKKEVDRLNPEGEPNDA